jgi:CDP-diglyceride synthetase
MSKFIIRSISVFMLFIGLSAFYGILSLLNLTPYFFKGLFYAIIIGVLIEFISAIYYSNDLSVGCKLRQVLLILTGTLFTISFCSIRTLSYVNILLFSFLSILSLIYSTSFAQKHNRLLNMGAIIALVCFTLLTLHQLYQLIIDQNIMAIISLQVIASLSDSIAYAAGSLTQAKPLGLVVSPNKSAIGFLSAVMLTPPSYIFLGQYVPLMDFSLSWICFSTIIAILGDMIFSLGKRILMIKDYGSLMPGHGGVLDRLDSLFGLISWYTWLCLTNII